MRVIFFRSMVRVCGKTARECQTAMGTGRRCASLMASSHVEHLIGVDYLMDATGGPSQTTGERPFSLPLFPFPFAIILGLLESVLNRKWRERARRECQLKII